MSRNGDLYNEDFYAWTQQQAALLEARQFDALDLPNLVEEITSLRKSEQRELANRLSPLLEYLLKLTIAAERLPQDLERAGRGWRTTCRTQRLRLAKLLRQNPSLRPLVPEEVGDAYAIARLDATQALGMEEGIVPLTCPWTPEQVLDEGFWPEETPGCGRRPWERREPELP